MIFKKKSLIKLNYFHLSLNFGEVFPLGTTLECICIMDLLKIPHMAIKLKKKKNENGHFHFYTF
jgi:hypothetical protein